MKGIERNFEILKGLILKSVKGEKGDDEIFFHTTDGRSFRLFHYQD